MCLFLECSLCPTETRVGIIVLQKPSDVCVCVFKILGEMAKRANKSLDKQTRCVNDESVTGFFCFSLCAEGGGASGFSHYCPCRFHWTLTCFSSSDTLKWHPIRLSYRGIEKHGAGCSGFPIRCQPQMKGRRMTLCTDAARSHSCSRRAAPTSGGRNRTNTDSVPAVVKQHRY